MNRKHTRMYALIFIHFRVFIWIQYSVHLFKIQHAVQVYYKIKYVTKLAWTNSDYVSSVCVCAHMPSSLWILIGILREKKNTMWKWIQNANSKIQTLKWIFKMMILQFKICITKLCTHTKNTPTQYHDMILWYLWKE